MSWPLCLLAINYLDFSARFYIYSTPSYCPHPKRNFLFGVLNLPSYLLYQTYVGAHHEGTVLHSTFPFNLRL
jgi:hypothetical protein